MVTRRCGLTTLVGLLCAGVSLHPIHASAATQGTGTVATKKKHVAPGVAPVAAPAAIAPMRAHRLVSKVDPEEVSVVAAHVPSAVSPSTPIHSTTQVTIVTGKQLAASGQPNVMQALAQLNPSISSPPNGGAGGNGFVQTMQLRGLNADDTLILVNGHRRHTGANFNYNAGPNWGTTPTDISLIPISAIDHVEVITEGATALYGPEAVAGAVNIVLESSVGGSATFKNSGYYGGAGQAIDGFGDYGFALGNTGGTMHLAAQVTHQLPANATGNFIGTLYADPVKNATASRDVGRSQGIVKSTLETISENTDIPIFSSSNSDFTFYSTSTFSHRTAIVAEAFRSTTDSLVNVALFPNGTEPYITLNEYDFQTDNGIKAHKFGFAWDAYITYGRDNQSYGIKDTDNPSLGKADTQTRFYEGTNVSSELTAGLKGSRAIDLPFLARPLYLSFGGEYRHDDFRVIPGAYGSYYGYGATDHSGDPQSAKIYENRDIFDGKVNLQFYITPKWEWTLGGHVTSYNNIATVETGSVGTRYNFNSKWAIRASVNSGYRPATLAAMYYYYDAVFPTYTNFILPVNGTAAKSLGGGSVKGEQSVNYSIGIDANPTKNLNFTGNLYYIGINDRLASTTTLQGSYVSSVLQTAGLITSNTSGYASYYTNPVNTATYGGDFSGNYTVNTKKAGQFLFQMGINFTDNEIRSYNANPAVLTQHKISAFNSYAAYMLLRSAPRNRESISMTWTRGKWKFFAAEQRYGSYIFAACPTCGQEKIEPSFITNMALTYNILPYWSATIGANNLTNTFPTRTRGLAATTSSGAFKYPTFSPIGVMGGMYYVMTSINF